MERQSNDLFFFNGIEARSGKYLFTPQTAPELLAGLSKLPKSKEKALVPGVDPKDLSEAGWGIVFHERENPAVREALLPLLEHRKARASLRFEPLYQEYAGERAFQDGESKESFLTRRGASLGPVNPHRMPYYLLLVGEPKLIPFDFQHQLDLQYAVGRICFDTPAEYASYAQRVVAAETGSPRREKSLALFGVRNLDDYATSLSAEYLIQPLSQRLGSPADWQESKGWKVCTILGEEATKARLVRLAGGDETPAILFTASHGMGFPCGDPLQRSHQGALLCQDWPGPKEWQRSVTPDLYFSSDDVGSGVDLAGLVAFHFACHGAGTPEKDQFAMRNGGPPRTLTPEPFVARLPQRLLNSGALAVIGHVERAWAYSFLSKASTSQVDAFESALRLLMDGYPVGFAMEYFNQQYGELSADLTLVLQRVGYGEKIDPKEIAGLWTANNDARSYSVVGDPAVRVSVR